MSGIDTSTTEQFIRERTDGLIIEAAAGDLAGMTLRGIKEQKELRNDEEKKAQLVSLNASLVDTNMSHAIQVFAILNLQPDHPDYATYKQALDGIIDARTTHASFILLNLVRNIHTTGDNIIDYTTSGNPLLSTAHGVKRERDALKTYLQNGPRQPFFEWSDSVVHKAASESDRDAEVRLARTHQLSDIAAEAVAVEYGNGEYTLDLAIRLAEVCSIPVITYKDAFTEENRLQIVDYAAATLALLRQVPRWQSRPDYVSRVSALAMMYDKFRFLAESTVSSRIEFEATVRQLQKENKSQDAVAARTKLVGSATVAETIEEPVIDFEAPALVKNLTTLVNPKKEDVKKQLSETSKRIDQGDSDPLIQLQPCPEGAQGQVKKLIITIAGSNSPEQILGLVQATAARNVAHISDEAVRTTVEACQWLQTNITALAHLRYTYRNHQEGFMVREVKNRFKAYLQAQESENANGQ